MPARLVTRVLLALLLIVGACAGGPRADDPDLSSPAPRPVAPAAPRTSDEAASVPVPVAAAAAGRSDGAPEGAPLYDQEVEIVARARRIADSGAEPPAVGDDVRQGLIACRVLLMRDQRRAALAAYAELRRQHPDDPLVLIGLARVCMDGAEYGTAVDLLRRADSAIQASGVPGIGHAELRSLHGICLLHAGRVDEGIALLREELAEGERPAAAAYELVDHLATRERVGDALAVVQAARARVPDGRGLALLEARLLRDLNRWPEAREMLVALVEASPDEPRARLDLCRAERVLGRLPAAFAEIDYLLGPLGGDSWVTEHHDALARLRAELQAEADGSPRQYSATELFAVLRAGATTAERLSAFGALVEVPAARERALWIAGRLDDPILRVQAIRAAPAAAQGFAEAVAAALGDEDLRVRGAAAVRAKELGAERAVPLLVQLLAAESDGYAFLLVHDALRALCGPVVDLPAGGEREAGVRQKTYQAWREWTWKR